MTLSDDDLVARLRKQFVVGWVNTEGDAAAGGSFAHEPHDPAGTCIRGNGKQNLQLLVLDPQGRIVHALAGFANADVLRHELDYAQRTLDLAAKAGGLASEAVAERARDYEAPEPTGIDKEMRERFAENTRDAVGAKTGSPVETVLSGLFDDRSMEFVARNPLMPVAQFRTSMLGGGGASFFGSSSGGKPGKTIGKAPRGMPPIGFPTGETTPGSANQ